jgi:SAM-dependent methyltransferase
VVKLAGYTSEELAALPADAVVNSFGCGNPLAFSEIREGEVVLDLGSGAGIDILLAAKKVGPSGKVIGVDMTDEMIAKGAENVAAAELNNVELRKGLIEDLPVENESVDWVISNCVINLSPEKPKVFAEIARVLKPGGRMLVSDIVAEELPAWIRTNEALHNSCVAGAISEAAYLDGLGAVGLTDVEVRERIVYDASHLKAFVTTELPDNEELASCCGGPVTPESIDAFVETMAGKVWSAKIYAKKPGPACCS